MANVVEMKSRKRRAGVILRSFVRSRVILRLSASDVRISSLCTSSIPRRLRSSCPFSIPELNSNCALSRRMVMVMVVEELACPCPSSTPSTVQSRPSPTTSIAVFDNRTSSTLIHTHKMGLSKYKKTKRREAHHCSCASVSCTSFGRVITANLQWMVDGWAGRRHINTDGDGTRTGTGRCG